MAKERKNDTYAEFQNRRNAYIGFGKSAGLSLGDESLLKDMFSRMAVPGEADAAQSQGQNSAADCDEGRESGNSSSSRASK